MTGSRTETAKLEALTGKLWAMSGIALDADDGYTRLNPHARDLIEQAARALSRPAVKGLEWRDHTKGPGCPIRRIAQTSTCVVWIFQAGEADRWYLSYNSGLNGKFLVNGTEDEAKSAAQSDFEQRISSSLSPPTGGLEPGELQLLLRLRADEQTGVHDVVESDPEAWAMGFALSDRGYLAMVPHPRGATFHITRLGLSALPSPPEAE